MEYDSSKDTMQHIQRVSQLLNKMVLELMCRMQGHDASKLRSPEKEIFDVYTPKLKECVYGSEEYQTHLTEMKVALEHHYKNNRHHIEHFKNGIQGMTLIDLIEMICDWKAATLRNKDGDILKSIEMNQKRFGYSDELKQILINTVKEEL